MEKYNEDYLERLERDLNNGRITFAEYYEEYIKTLCILEVGEENFDFYDLADNDLYIYCHDDTIKVIENFY